MKNLLSVIIPSYKDPFLHKTIDSIIKNFEGDFEIVVILDGYWTEFIDDPRLKIVHLGKNRGMRGAINAGVAVAKGDYLMRADEHCLFAKGFDTTILKDIKDNEIVTATRFFLDPKKWEVMDIKPVQHEKLVIQGEMKFAGQRWPSRDKKQKDVMISETMAMQGSCWFMKKSWWDKVIKRLETENYGPLYQDSHEMVFKTWKAGGRIMLNRNSWFAHKHRSFTRTHSNGTTENPSNNSFSWGNALKIWREYYENEIKPKQDKM